jgi:hypothetical protein
MLSSATRGHVTSATSGYGTRLRATGKRGRKKGGRRNRGQGRPALLRVRWELAAVLLPLLLVHSTGSSVAVN